MNDKIFKKQRGVYSFRGRDIIYFKDEKAWEIVIELKSRTVGPWSFQRLKYAIEEIKLNSPHFRLITENQIRIFRMALRETEDANSYQIDCGGGKEFDRSYRAVLKAVEKLGWSIEKQIRKQGGCQ